MPAAETRITARIEAAIADKVFPGCVIGIISKGASTILVRGAQSYDAGAEPAGETTTYDLASVTKSIPVAALAALLMTEGKLALTDTIQMHLPELQNHHGATIEDLLRYHVRGPQLSKLRLSTFEEIRTHVFEHGFDRPAGERSYTNLPALLLGIIIERAAGEMLPALSDRMLFEPLGMTKTTFFPAASDCAPTEIDERGEVRGLPHDESAYVFARAHHGAGHAGLFSTAGDLLIFLETLLQGRLPAVSSAAEAGLGWERDAEWMGSHAAPTAYGKTGFTGTCVCVDHAKETAFVILSNRTYPKRPADGEAINAFRADIADLILA